MATPKKTAPKKAAPTAPVAEVTPVSAWKARAGGQPLELPSGNVALVRVPGMQAFVASGIIPNSLMPIVNEAIEKHTTPSMEEVMANTNMLRDMTVFMDNVVIHCFTEPKVHHVPNPGVDREPDKLYVDEIDAEDKSFVFQLACGGTRDLERFRRERDEAMADVAALTPAQVQAVGAAGS